MENNNNILKMPEELATGNASETPGKFILATNNENKLREMRDILSENNIKIEIKSPERRDSKINRQIVAFGDRFKTSGRAYDYSGLRCFTGRRRDQNGVCHGRICGVGAGVSVACGGTGTFFVAVASLCYRD